MAKSSKPANPRSNHQHKKSRDPRSHHKTTELQAAREIRRLTKTSQRCRRQLAEAVKPLVSMLRSSESPLVALSFFFFEKRNPSHIRFFLPLSLSLRSPDQTKTTMVVAHSSSPSPPMVAPLSLFISPKVSTLSPILNTTSLQPQALFSVWFSLKKTSMAKTHFLGFKQGLDFVVAPCVWLKELSSVGLWIFCGGGCFVGLQVWSF